MEKTINIHIHNLIGTLVVNGNETENIQTLLTEALASAIRSTQIEAREQGQGLFSDKTECSSDRSGMPEEDH